MDISCRVIREYLTVEVIYEQFRKLIKMLLVITLMKIKYGIEEREHWKLLIYKE
jgi:hypothetical protein